jgi:hypothetical protein
MLFLVQINQDTNQILLPKYYACITHKKFAGSYADYFTTNIACFATNKVI